MKIALLIRFLLVGVVTASEQHADAVTANLRRQLQTNLIVDEVLNVDFSGNYASSAAFNLAAPYNNLFTDATIQLFKFTTLVSGGDMSICKVTCDSGFDNYLTYSIGNPTTANQVFGVSPLFSCETATSASIFTHEQLMAGPGELFIAYRTEGSTSTNTVISCSLSTNLIVDADLAFGTPSASFDVGTGPVYNRDTTTQLFRVTTPVSSGERVTCSVTCDTGVDMTLRYSLGNPMTAGQSFGQAASFDCTGTSAVYTDDQFIFDDGELYISYLSWSFSESRNVVVTCAVIPQPTFAPFSPPTTPPTVAPTDECAPSPSDNPDDCNFAVAAIRSVSTFLGFGGSK